MEWSSQHESQLHSSARRTFFYQLFPSSFSQSVRKSQTFSCRQHRRMDVARLLTRSSVCVYVHACVVVWVHLCACFCTYTTSVVFLIRENKILSGGMEKKKNRNEVWSLMRGLIDDCDEWTVVVKVNTPFTDLKYIDADTLFQKYLLTEISSYPNCCTNNVCLLTISPQCFLEGSTAVEW